MAWALKLLETAAGVTTEFDNLYVRAYDPTYDPPGEDYCGGILEVTSDIRRALAFETSAEAFAKWRQAYGIRSDGRPNRPLTAWSIECELIEGADGDGVARSGEDWHGEAQVEEKTK